MAEGLTELMYRCLDIFPDIDRNYLISICSNQPLTDENFNNTVDMISSVESYPKRTISEDDIQKKALELQIMFPNYDPDFIELKCREINIDPDQIHVLVSQLINDELPHAIKKAASSWTNGAKPKKPKSEAAFETFKRYITRFDATLFLQEIPEPTQYFTKSNAIRTKLDMKSPFTKYLLKTFYNLFHHLPLATIENVLIKNQYNLIDAHKELTECKEKMPKNRKREILFPPLVCDDLYTVQETYITRFDATLFLQEIPEPTQYFTKSNAIRTKLDIKSPFTKYLLKTFYNLFHHLPLATIENVLIKNQYNLIDAHKELSESNEKMPKNRKREILFPPLVCDDLYTVQELDIKSPFTKYLLKTFYNLFHHLPLATIENVLIKNQYNLIDAHKELSESKEKMPKNRKREILFPPLVCDDLYTVQELAYILHRNEITKLYNAKKNLHKRQLERAKRMGHFYSCEICLEEVLLKNITECEAGHIFCQNCVKNYLDAQLAQAKVEFFCLADCDATFNYAVLSKLFSEKVYRQTLQRKQIFDLRQAGIENVETCPYCNEYVALVEPGTLEFTCQNDECQKVSCLKCHRLSHLPRNCGETPKEYKDRIKREKIEKERKFAEDEAEKKKNLEKVMQKAKTLIEDKMSEAIIRTCPRCQTKFVKSEGCNFMTCPTCKTNICYLCNEIITSYGHFINTNCQSDRRADELDRQRVISAAETSARAVMRENPQIRVVNNVTNRNVAPPTISVAGTSAPSSLNRPFDTWEYL